MPEDKRYEYEVLQAASAKFAQGVRDITKKPLIEFSSSTVKRTSKSIDQVHSELTEQGFEHTGDALDGRVHYHENEGGFNLTIVETRRGTVVIPSGPVRGNLFGDQAVSLNINR